MKLFILVALFGLGLAQHNPQFKNGRTSIVHLFEWRWADIAQECERFLGPKGFGGVQISPPNEHILVSNPFRPWWQRYQPIGYNLCSRSGSESELKDMITRCNNVGIRFVNYHPSLNKPNPLYNYTDPEDEQPPNRRLVGKYQSTPHPTNMMPRPATGSFRQFSPTPKPPQHVEPPFNAFTIDDSRESGRPLIKDGLTQQVRVNSISEFAFAQAVRMAQIRSRSDGRCRTPDIYPHPGVNIYVDAVINHMCGSGGGAGTHSACGSWFDAGKKDFPSVPYSNLDFNDNKCKTGSGEIENYGDIYQVRDCRLVGLLDLALEKDYVRGKVAEYMNKLINMGVAGFRVDACKHMWPGDLSAVYGRLNNLNTQWFPGGSRPFIYQEVIDLGGEPITANEYVSLGRVTEFKYGAKLGEVFRRWNNQKLSYTKNWGEGWGFMANGNALAFIDNHDNQRGHGAGGAAILTFWDPRLYKMAVGFMLAHPYGVTRVMSSYRWDRNIVNGQDQNDWIGPPSNGDGSTKPVSVNPDQTCGDGWVCEHRWRQITNMVIFRNVVNGQPLSNWWDNQGNQVAFGRGNRGFIVFNNEDGDLNVTLNTGMPGGTYCDVISGQKEGSKCTGKQVNVGGDGRATFSISGKDEDPFIAIHADSKL